jgi:hypothetical protein
MKLKSLPGAALAWLRATRCKWLLLLVLLGLVLRENYPFSHYPMYSSFSRRTYFLYLAAPDGTALGTRQFGLSSSTLKKIFDHFRRKELRHFADAGEDRVPVADAAAGESLLRYLDGLTKNRPQAKRLLPGLQVEHVLVRQKGSALVLETSTVARHR